MDVVMSTDITEIDSNSDDNTTKSFEWLLPAIKHNLKSAAEKGFASSTHAFENAMSHCQPALQAAARTVSEQQDKEQFIEAMEICQLYHSQMANDFKRELIQAYDILTDHAQPAAKASLLNEDSDMYNRIMAHKIIADAQRHFGDNINACHSGVQSSLTNVTVNNQNNPFGPNILVESSLISLSAQAFQPEALQCILLHLQKVWLTQLAGFYHAINESLKQAGLDLNKQHGVKAQPIPTATPRAPSTPAQEKAFSLETVETEVFNGTTPYDDNASPISFEAADAIGLIQTCMIPPDLKQTQYASMQSSASANSTVISKDALVSIISSMQKGYEPHTDGDVIRVIRQQLALQNTPSQQMIIGQTEENTINLISLCFRAIAAPLPKGLEPLILRLKPAFAIIALNDDVFFHDNLHPARQLLDQLLGLINSNFADEVISQYVKAVVIKVQLKFNGDMALFEQLMHNIDTYLATEKKRFKSNQNTLIKRFADDENLQMAITACEKYIQKQIDTLPSNLEYFEFFKALLSPALAKVYLTYSGKSEQWLSLEKNIRYIFAMLGNQDVEILRQQAKFLAHINAELSLVLNKANVSIKHKHMLLEQLQDIQILQMQGTALSSIYDSQLKHHAAISDYLAQQKQTLDSHFNSSFVGYQHHQLKTARFARMHEPMSKREAAKICAKLIIGEWLCILIEQQPVRLQYGFYARTTQTLVFFNSNHEKAIERTRDDLINDIATGFACPIEEVANFDTALKQVENALEM